MATGYRGYTPYIAMPGRGTTAAWEGIMISGFSKVREELGLRGRDIVLARLVSWVPSFLASAFFILLAWRAWGLPSPQMPCISVLMGLPVVRMLAERRVQGIIDPLTFLSAAVIGALLEALTPISMMGMAMGLLLPPYYSVPFAVGGLLRARLERRKGRDWLEQRGMVIVSSLIASSVLGQLAALGALVLIGLL